MTLLRSPTMSVPWLNSFAPDKFHTNNLHRSTINPEGCADTSFLPATCRHTGSEKTLTIYHLAAYSAVLAALPPPLLLPDSHHSLESSFQRGHPKSEEGYTWTCSNLIFISSLVAVSTSPPSLSCHSSGMCLTLLHRDATGTLGSTDSMFFTLSPYSLPTHDT